MRQQILKKKLSSHKNVSFPGFKKPCNIIRYTVVCEIRICLRIYCMCKGTITTKFWSLKLHGYPWGHVIEFDWDFTVSILFPSFWSNTFLQKRRFEFILGVAETKSVILIQIKHISACEGCEKWLLINYQLPRSLWHS